MPRQNRVTPLGHIIATPVRGTLMGNRGCLHDSQGNIRRIYQNKRWIICQLSFKNRQRQVMMPGRYTELFFLDEVTALAAGHRPCAECMRSRFNQFRDSWGRANKDLIGRANVTAGLIDSVLHAERLTSTGQKFTYTEQLNRLPSGTFVTLEPGEKPYLLLEDELYLWHPEGYERPISYPPDTVGYVLTPRSTVRALAVGYAATIFTPPTPVSASPPQFELPA